MQFSSALSTVAAALSLAAGARAWAQDGSNGQWVANNVVYQWDNIRVHEACTYKDSQLRHEVHDNCAYWIDGNGNKAQGICAWWDATLQFMNCVPY